MAGDEERDLAELDASFNLLVGNTKAGLAYEEIKRQDGQWKTSDPEGYKKDMEDLCKSVFPDNWEIEYEAMLREEFPEDFDD